MDTEKLPRHALFIQWGRLRAGAFGWPAVLLLGGIILVLAANW